MLAGARTDEIGRLSGIAQRLTPFVVRRAPLCRVLAHRRLVAHARLVVVIAACGKGRWRLTDNYRQHCDTKSRGPHGFPLFPADVRPGLAARHPGIGAGFLAPGISCGAGGSASAMADAAIAHRRTAALAGRLGRQRNPCDKKSKRRHRAQQELHDFPQNRLASQAYSCSEPLGKRGTRQLQPPRGRRREGYFAKVLAT